ncbi:histone acetyltransferase, putative [Plasmodium knowlesi strain H]|uniref:RNA cytidine acetyltransferase n=3 Tax=Plasmodium knowlesi TaxID=5850 RepID=A0A5K1U491_PLAKH|nr:N-acetyltransferase, GNAT family, putative [Plasmodium knowlesi strain H]OTN68234.1 RNA cytidine acetyltransferase [Plasmodium knowlesi]CAA9987099.1 N-acetyltransferase, GNAT family, putative [Plasmodium knowlesi strain H]SBO23835.1 histone acetyltransferase, putative [Plasmodium knowlesi strain H]SBO25619.1 histone acetyltransferase, putative [Plasmodium knowlesi strain H]VVS76573.1 N-acetyltransferase, GNAT family, putative [Plasmodium knowlesi strain H]|eukprot:XP_002261721.1 ATPase, putative [Plasmodium knowlesi strain H]
MKKKVDGRIKTLVENNVALGQRSMFLVVGDQGKNVVVNFYFLLNRLASRTHKILWCYKKKLEFSTSKKKRFREMKKKIKKGTFDTTIDNHFDAFLKSANIRFCFYNETKKVLGKTYSMCVLQDFSYITPNILCRCIETVIGGGIILFLLNKLDDVKNIYNITLNCHKKYTQSGISSVYNNYITRFFLSLNECSNAMFIDDEMNILPLNDNHLHVKKLVVEERQEGDVSVNASRAATLGGYLCPDKEELRERLAQLEAICDENERKAEEHRRFLYSARVFAGGEGLEGKKTNRQTDKHGIDKHGIEKHGTDKHGTDKQVQGQIESAGTDEQTNQYSFLNRPIMNLLRICLTIDQLEVLLNMCKILRNDEEKKRQLKEVLINLLANRGRGKSATLGLLIALSIYFNYTNVILCSGNNDGMQTIYEFIDQGLHLLGYKEFSHYERIQNQGKLKEIIVFKDIHNLSNVKQRIRYFDILEEDMVNSELMIIDEAACIPIDILRGKIKGEITILSTTLNGYEGTGKTFIFKLLKQLKKKFVTQLSYGDFKKMKRLYFERAFIDISLGTPIRYSYNDQVEAWLNNFLCLNCNEPFKLKNSLCSPVNCQLYLVNKNIFKRFTKTSENFLKKIMVLFVTSHYKNTPNDLIMILDSQQHHLFVLLSGNVDCNNLSAEAVDELDIYGVLHCAIDGIVHPPAGRRLVKLQDLTKGGEKHSQVDEQVDSQADEQMDEQVDEQVDEQMDEQMEEQVNGERNGDYFKQGGKPSDDRTGGETANPTTEKHSMPKEFEGNLMPYLVTEHFDYYFYNYIGIRVVRISIHPSIQNLNYGSQFLRKLFDYYSLYNGRRGREAGVPYRENVILYRCSGDGGEGADGRIFFDKQLSHVDYVGTCFGLTKGLLIFWQKNNFIPVYLKQQRNEITGEFSLLMLRHLNVNLKKVFTNFYLDFVRSFCSLLPYSFRRLESFVVFNLLHNNPIVLTNPTRDELLLPREKGKEIEKEVNVDVEEEKGLLSLPDEDGDQYACFYDDELLSQENLFYFFHPNDICRLKRFVMEAKPFADILYLMQTVANLILFRKVPIQLTFLEYTILYAVSLQKKNTQEISNEISIHVNQTIALLRKVLHRFYTYLKDLMQRDIEKKVEAQFSQKLHKKKKRARQVELPSEEYIDELNRNTRVVTKKNKKEKRALLREFNLSGTVRRKQINIKTNDGADPAKDKVTS